MLPCIEFILDFFYFVVVLVVDIPAETYLDSLQCNKHLNSLLRTIGKNKLDFIVHFTPKHICELEQYRKCIAQMNGKREFLLNDSSGYGLCFLLKLYSRFTYQQSECLILFVPNAQVYDN